MIHDFQTTLGKSFVLYKSLCVLCEIPGALLIIHLLLNQNIVKPKTLKTEKKQCFLTFNLRHSGNRKQQLIYFKP
jgi:hypothetical protein